MLVSYLLDLLIAIMEGKLDVLSVINTALKSKFSAKYSERIQSIKDSDKEHTRKIEK